MTGRRPELDREARRYFIYRLSDGEGMPLYVGRSCQPLARLRQHHGEHAWAVGVVQVEAWGPLNWREACDAEREMITASRPLHNRMFIRSHTGRRKVEIA